MIFLHFFDVTPSQTSEEDQRQNKHNTKHEARSTKPTTYKNRTYLTAANNEQQMETMNPDDYVDDDDDDIMDALEEEMDRDVNEDEMDLIASAMDNTIVTKTAGSTKAAAISSLPSHMVNHAAEFWFPECRGCDCCKGFKHGCSCGGLCVCSVDNKVEASTAHGKIMSIKNVITPTMSKQEGRHGGSSKIPCRFYQMGTCKFGDNCRFPLVPEQLHVILLCFDTLFQLTQYHWNDQERIEISFSMFHHSWLTNKQVSIFYFHSFVD